jgi:hypothetical protein
MRSIRIHITRQLALATTLAAPTLTLIAPSTDGRWTLDLSERQWQMEGISPGQGER